MNIPNKASVGEPHTGAMAKGRSLAAPGTAQTAGGANIKKPLPFMSATGGSALNKRSAGLRSGSERHYNGKTSLPTSISNTRP